jgi:hypothetical protein
MKLYVDDIRNPDHFLPGEGWTWVKTITEAIRMLASQDVTDVSLDHDICHAILPGDDNGRNIYQPVVCPEDYTAVAHYIAALPQDLRPHTVYIHTANPMGADRISHILRLAKTSGMKVVRRPA